MTVIHTIFDIDIGGTVDQAGLNLLRAHLNLTSEGRLTDDWDQAFGNRMIKRTADRYKNINLFRNDDGSWKVSVCDTEKRDPNDPELTALCAELVDGITAAGYQATVRAKPSYGSRPPT